MKNNKRIPSVVILIILTMLMVFLWIGFSIYNALNTQPPVEVPPEIMAPLDPTLNQEYLNQLPNTIYFDNVSSGTTQIVIINQVEASPTASPEATPIATESASPAATIEPSPTP